LHVHVKFEPIGTQAPPLRQGLLEQGFITDLFKIFIKKKKIKSKMALFI